MNRRAPRAGRLAVGAALGAAACLLILAGRFRSATPPPAARDAPAVKWACRVVVLRALRAPPRIERPVVGGTAQAHPKLATVPPPPPKAAGRPPRVETAADSIPDPPKAPVPVATVAEPEVAPPSSSPRELGRQLLGADGKREGTVPLISMDYRRNLGWDGYARAVQRLGGLFFIYDPAQERMLALADVAENRLLPATQEGLVGLSPRLREIRGEIAVEGLMGQARARWPGRDLALVLLLPLNADFDLVGGIVQGLAARGFPPGSVARVVGGYETAGSGLRLRVDEVVRRDGTSAVTGFTVELKGAGEG